MPSHSLISLKVQPAISNPCSTLGIFSFNEIKNKVKIKPIVIYQCKIYNRSYFFNCPRLDLHWCGYAMYFQGIQTPRSQFKRGINLDWQGYSPLTPNGKIAINKSWKTTQHFFHTPPELKVIVCVTCTLWKIAGRDSRVIHSNYTHLF